MTKHDYPNSILHQENFKSTTQNLANYCAAAALWKLFTQ